MTVKSRASAKAWVKACCAIAAVSSWASFASSSKSTRAERSAKEVRAASSQSMVDVSSGPGQDTASKTSLRPRTTPHRWYHCASDPSLPESVSQRVWPTSTRTMRGFRVRTALSVLHADCRDSSVLLLRFRSKGPKACSLAKDDASIVLSRGGAMCSAKCVNTAAVATGEEVVPGAFVHLRKERLERSQLPELLDKGLLDEVGQRLGDDRPQVVCPHLPPGVVTSRCLGEEARHDSHERKGACSGSLQLQPLHKCVGDVAPELHGGVDDPNGLRVLSEAVQVGPCGGEVPVKDAVLQGDGTVQPGLVDLTQRGMHQISGECQGIQSPLAIRQLVLEDLRLLHNQAQKVAAAVVFQHHVLQLAYLLWRRLSKRVHPQQLHKLWPHPGRRRTHLQPALQSTEHFIRNRLVPSTAHCDAVHKHRQGQRLRLGGRIGQRVVLGVHRFARSPSLAPKLRVWMGTARTRQRS
eukprot:scaffold3307_cov265-Pinguiococcus_pyrenoidosus.AAC.13